MILLEFELTELPVEAVAEAEAEAVAEDGAVSAAETGAAVPYLFVPSTGLMAVYTEFRLADAGEEEEEEEEDDPNEEVRTGVHPLYSRVDSD